LSKKKGAAPKKPQIEQRARKLKSIGALDIDLRKKIDARQAKRINEVYRDLKDVADNPKLYKRIKNASRGQVRAAKGSSFAAYKDSVWVKQFDAGKGSKAKKRFDTVKLIDNRIVTYKREDLAAGEVVRKEMTKLGRGVSLENVERILEKYGGELPKGKYLMLRVGDKSPFAASVSAKELAGYLQQSNAWPKLQRLSESGQIGKISIVVYDKKVKPKRPKK
jgi:hypothetical protein